MLTLRPVPDALRDTVLDWRNAEPVRRMMITRDPISADQHRAWWDRVQVDPTRRLLLLSQGEVPLGIITFFDIANSSAWWGFYPAQDEAGHTRSDMASWLALVQAAIAYAFEVLALERLLCETRSVNRAVLAAHERMGFKPLPQEDFPNALAHDLQVKELTAEGYDMLRSQGDLPSDLVIRRSIHDEPEVDGEALPKGPRVALLGSANWDLAARDLHSAFAESVGVLPSVYVPPFGQAFLELMTEGSDLRAQDWDIVVFAERIEDFIDPFAPATAADADTVRELFAAYLERIRQARLDMPSALFLIHDFRPTRRWPQTLAEQNGADPVLDLCAALNADLDALIEELDETLRLPLAGLIADAGLEGASPGKFWLLGRIAYGRALTEAWARLVVGVDMARSGRTARALVLDLDNTLWGGVIGDDGIGGVQLGSDYPGNEFKAFQHVIREIRARGLPLTIASKNTHEVAMEAIENHPEMVLRPDDFIATRINWEPKSANILELAEELSLGAGSLMFIDDNPVERAEVRRNAPQVIVPEMPQDVTLWPDFLLSHPALTMLTLSAEDRGRVRSYEIRKQVEQAERSATTRESFLADLGMELEIAPLSALTRQRALQLIAKTNQFNTTGRRYSESDLAALMAEDGQVLTLRLRDRFGSDEVIGVLITRPEGDALTIENFIMSCRVLGRGVESAALAVLSEQAARIGGKRLSGQIIETERNLPCRAVYSDHGFEEAPDGRFDVDLTAGALPRPGWMQITDHTTTEGNS